MRIVRNVAALGLDRLETIGLVPTMGAFHEGHLSLMRAARPRCETLVVSLFVNPTQFGKGEDFESYPRNEDRDFALAESCAVDVMFAPSIDEMYRTRATSVHVSGLTELWEGAIRPNHFDGVATVVAKLFNIVRPGFAVFGVKDYQQCKAIERMVSDLNMPIELYFEPTVREPDGLAMSSRNAYLSAHERTVAPRLHEELVQLASAVEGLSRNPPSLLPGDRRNGSSEIQIQELIDAASRRLASAGFNVDYLELVDADTLEVKRTAQGPGRVIAAARLGNTRLIDNEPLALSG